MRREDDFAAKVINMVMEGRRKRGRPGWWKGYVEEDLREKKTTGDKHSARTLEVIDQK